MSPPAASGPMSLGFARVYEATATRITGPVSFAALSRLGPVGRGTRVLDVAAATGAFAIPAAHAGTAVTAVDIAPGMIELLSERLHPFPSARALVMDGEALTFADGSFDASVSIMGVSLFKDWHKGLAEQVRVLRSGGKAVLATWRVPPGGGPFVVMAQAMRTVFPDRPPPPAPDGFLHLSDPGRMTAAMQAAGLHDVTTDVIDAVWEGPAGQAYLDELRDLHGFMPPYAALNDADRERVDAAIVAIVDGQARNGRIDLPTQVVLSAGTRG